MSFGDKSHYLLQSFAFDSQIINHYISVRHAKFNFKVASSSLISIQSGPFVRYCKKTAGFMLRFISLSKEVKTPATFELYGLTFIV